MGIHELAVRFGLAYTSHKEAEFKVAKFIAGKFHEAATLYVDSRFKKGKSLKFRKAVIAVWTPNDRVKRCYIDDPYLLKYFPELCGKEHSIEIGAAKNWGGTLAHVKFDGDNNYLGMYIATGNIDSCETYDEFKKYFQIILGSIYHECDHLYSPNKVIADQETEATLLYLMDPSEIRAHSKEYAFLYHSLFPGERFSFKKLRDHVFSNYGKSENPYRFMNWLSLMQDPKTFVARSEKERKVIGEIVLTPGHPTSKSELKKVFAAYSAYLTEFVDYFNKHPEHRVKLDFKIK